MRSKAAVTSSALLSREAVRRSPASSMPPLIDSLVPASCSMSSEPRIGHVGDDPLAGLAEGGGDQRAALVEGGRDALAGGGRRRRRCAGADRLELGREVLVRARDRRAHALGVGDDRLALRDELVDKRADADLVIGIGALERRDLAAHERLELARPRERPLDAVADGRDLAAHRLRDRCDRIRRIGLGLGEADRDLADGAGEELHLLRAHGEHRGDVEEDHRPEQGDQRRPASAAA